MQTIYVIKETWSCRYFGKYKNQENIRTKRPTRTSESQISDIPNRCLNFPVLKEDKQNKSEITGRILT